MVLKVVLVDCILLLTSHKGVLMNPSYYHGYNRISKPVPVSIEDVKDLLAVLHPLELAMKLCLNCPYTITRWVRVGRVPPRYFHRLGEVIQETVDKKIAKETKTAPSDAEIEFKEERRELSALEKAKLELMRARKSRLLKEIEGLKKGIMPEDDGIS